MSFFLHLLQKIYSYIDYTTFRHMEQEILQDLSQSVDNLIEAIQKNTAVFKPLQKL